MGHFYGSYRIRVHTNVVDGKGPYYTLSKTVEGRVCREIVGLTFDGRVRTFHAENTNMRDLRKAKKAAEKLAKLDEAGITPTRRVFAREAIRKARTALDNAARAFEADMYKASVEACREAQGRIETAVANMEKSE